MRTVRAAGVLLLIAYASNRLAAQDPSGISEAQSVLSPLIDSYGVSGAEGPVRELVKRLLPAWAKSETGASTSTPSARASAAVAAPTST